jgi:hypothetical protein
VQNAVKQENQKSHFVNFIYYKGIGRRSAFNGAICGIDSKNIIIPWERYALEFAGLPNTLNIFFLVLTEDTKGSDYNEDNEK